MAIDYGSLQGVNALGAFMGGQQAGQQMRAQKARQNALARYASGDVQGAAEDLIASGDLETGLTLRKMAAEDATTKRRAGYGEKVKGGDYTGARNDAIAGGDYDIAAEIGKLSDADKAKAAAQADYLAGFANTLKSKPPEQRKAVAETWAPGLVERGGLLPQQIAQLDLSDGSLDSMISGALSVKDQLDLAAKERANRLAQDRLDWERSQPNWKERKNADGSSEFVDLNTPGGNVPPPPAPPAANADEAVANLVAMGAKVTSGVRTPEHNAEVGGNPNSYHLASRGGVARDLVPPAGMKMDEFHRTVRESLPPGWEAINEGDHIHIEPGSYQTASNGQTPGRPRTVRGDAPQPQGRMATAEDRQRLGLPAEGNFWIEPSGKPTAIGGSSGAGSRKAFADLRKEFNGLDEVKAFKDVSASYRQVRSLASKAKATPMDDMSLTYSFMKMLDPGSVVREGEFAMVGARLGVPDRIQIALGKLDKGEGLTPGARKAISDAAATIMLQRREAYDAQSRTYRQIAGDLGLNPDQLVEDPAKWRTRIKSGGAAPKAPAGNGWGIKELP